MFMKTFLVFCWISAVLVTRTSGAVVFEKSDAVCNLSDALKNEISSYQEVANRIISAATSGKFKGSTYNELAKFVDKFGNRVSGSENLENAINYMLDKLNTEALDNVHGEEVSVPHWVRGEEYAVLLEPRVQNLRMLGLGGSVATPPEGIKAEVLVVTSFDELNQRKAEVSGKIVVFLPNWVSYGVTVQYRSHGASKAAKLGAVATLIRSVTPFSIYSPHTGWQAYEDGVTKIPTASITVEDAHMLKRMQDRGDKITIHLKMSAQNNPRKLSRNTVAELQGTEKPEKVIIVSGHLDSWDVGQGAMDDGGGAFISWNALAILNQLGLRPRRTVRAILWTSEEPGLVGAQAYAERHKNESENILFAMESDIGTFNPLGLEYSAGVQGGCILQEVVKLLAPINATQLKKSDDVGSDIGVFVPLGIPLGSLLNANEKYFWFHHSDGDTMDVEDPDELDRSLALWAVTSYVIADLSLDFPRGVCASCCYLRYTNLKPFGSKLNSVDYSRILHFLCTFGLIFIMG